MRIMGKAGRGRCNLLDHSAGSVSFLYLGNTKCFECVLLSHNSLF